MIENDQSKIFFFHFPHFPKKQSHTNSVTIYAAQKRDTSILINIIGYMLSLFTFRIFISFCRYGADGNLCGDSG